MAQEIQRKLEETEVKQKELESRGVSVEKALRGEGGKMILHIIFYLYSIPISLFYLSYIDVQVSIIFN